MSYTPINSTSQIPTSLPYHEDSDIELNDTSSGISLSPADISPPTFSPSTHPTSNTMWSQSHACITRTWAVCLTSAPSFLLMFLLFSDSLPAWVGIYLFRMYLAYA